MSEIDKLYENAGIEKAPDINNCYPEMMKCHHCEHYKVIDEYTGRCLNEVYPEFTAEKQLELIKWLIANGFCYFIISIKSREITEYLAKCVNEIWQNLTEEEKAEIKRILE